MNKAFKTLTIAILSLFFLTFTLIAQSGDPNQKHQEKKEVTVETPGQPSEMSSSLHKTVVNSVSASEESQKTFDQSLSILKLAATLMAILVSLVSLIVTVGGVLGFLQYQRLRKSIRRARQGADFINRMRKKVEADTADLLEELDKKRLEGGDRESTLGRDTEPTQELREKVEELGRKLELLESGGIKLGPKEYLAMAQNFYFNKKYNLALDAYTKVTELEPNNSLAWHRKGITLHRLDRNQEALEAINRAIELKADDATTWHNKGVILSILGRNQEAFEAYGKGVELKPDDTDSWYNMGVALCKLGRNQEAIEAYNKAIELKADFAMAWYNKACVYSILRDKALSLESLRNAVNIESSYRNMARTDEDFKWLREDQEFMDLTKEEAPRPGPAAASPE